VFVEEQEEYVAEGIAWDAVTFKDNALVVDLIQRPGTGLLDLLNEQCILPNGTDTRSMFAQCSLNVP
jgi:myosin-5